MPNAAAATLALIWLVPGTGSPPSVVLERAARDAGASWDAGRLALDVVNDALGTTMDEGWSSGMRVTTRFSPFIGDGVRGWLRGDLRRAARVEHWGATIAWDIYTPTDLDATTAEELADDRPYAGFMGGALFDEIVFAGSLAPGGYTIAHLSLEGGLVGPSTHTEEIQRTWHNWLRRSLDRQVTPRDPQGWDVYQIPDAFLVGLRARLESDAFRASWGSGAARDRHGSQGGSRLSGFTECDLGTIRVECDFGSTFRVGWMPDITLQGALPVNTWDQAVTGRAPRFPLSGYFFLSGIARVTLFNAFLDGPVGSTNSPTQDRRSLGAEAQAGIAARIGDFELLYRQIVQTREYEHIAPEAVKIQMLGQVVLSGAWD
jgi:hypothetical protein